MTLATAHGLFVGLLLGLVFVLGLGLLAVQAGDAYRGWRMRRDFDRYIERSLQRWEAERDALNRARRREVRG